MLHDNTLYFTLDNKRMQNYNLDLTKIEFYLFYATLRKQKYLPENCNPLYLPVGLGNGPWFRVTIPNPLHGLQLRSSL